MRAGAAEHSEDLGNADFVKTGVITAIVWEFFLKLLHMYPVFQKYSCRCAMDSVDAACMFMLLGQGVICGTRRGPTL